MAALLPARRLAGDDERKGGDTTFSTDVNVVNVFATVRNKQGQIVHDLNREDFILEEDDRPQTIRYFVREANLPLTLGLLVDTSGSQRRLIPDERRASYRFFDQVLREDKDLAFLIHFESEAELLQDLTSSRQQLERGLANLGETRGQGQYGGGAGGGGGGYPGGGYPGGRYPRGGGQRMGGTALFDAVFLAADEIMRKQSGRKAVVVLSDGVDNASKVTLSSAIESAQRADTLVYSILFEDPNAYGRGYGGYPRMGGRRGGMGGGRMPMPQAHPDGRKALQRLARETGGGFFEVSSKHPIEETFDRIQEELRNQYNLGYTPDRPGAGPGFRRIHLATAQKGLIVQTREGYYAVR